MAVRNQPGSETFQSILFADRESELLVDEPDFFRDLNLDQLLEWLTAEQEGYDLAPFFYTPLHDVDAVRYRHEILRDLEELPVLDAIRAFAEAMRTVRTYRSAAAERRLRWEQARWTLDASQSYCAAVRSLADALGGHVASRGLQAFRRYLTAYMALEAFAELEAETEAVVGLLSGVRYTVEINGGRVKVGRYQDEADYSVEVEETFARFKQGAVRDYLRDLRASAGLNHVEERILTLVARLFPDVFGSLERFFVHHQDFVDATIERFDREVRFYVAYLELIEPLRRVGLPFCYPRVSTRPNEIAAESTFDIALAHKLTEDRRRIVRNDFRLESPERIIVVTGPNNGGKTTFARMFGQLHHLAALGLLVPGRSARLVLPDRICTHFERQEDLKTLRGKLDDELVRVRTILDRATSASVLVMNESFGSTTLQDALFIGTEVMRRILELGSFGVYVTFVDELASMSEATVSMVSTVVPENPAQRTYEIVRRPADGLAYAWAIAEKYGLTYERLKERIA